MVVLILSHLHTKNRFEYTCIVPAYALTLTARYFLINENALGCILTLSTTAAQPLPVTCYLIHQHTHNPHTSRLWEHGLYAIPGPQEGLCLLGLASEGDAFAHGARSADGGELTFSEMGYLLTLEDASAWADGVSLPRPAVTEYDEQTGWQSRSLVLPCDLVLEGNETANPQRIINVVLARGVSQDTVYQGWLDGIEEIARANADHQTDDEAFWNQAPQLSGDWPAHWRRGLVYDLETLRMVIRPSVGMVDHYFDGMQIQAPRLVLAEAAMDALFLSYADPDLAAEVILGHFESAPRPISPVCVKMVAIIWLPMTARSVEPHPNGAIQSGVVTSSGSELAILTGCAASTLVPPPFCAGGWSIDAMPRAISFITVLGRAARTFPAVSAPNKLVALLSNMSVP